MHTYTNNLAYSGNIIFMPDYSGHYIKQIDVSTSPATVTTFAGTGTGTHVATSGPIGTATLKGPSGVAVNGSTMYVSSWTQCAISLIDTSAGTVSHIAGSSAATPVCGAANGDGSSATFSNPAGLAVDSSAGLLYIADYSNHRIRAMTLDPPYTVTTLAGTGANTSIDGPTSTATISAPSGLQLITAAGGIKRLYFIGQGSHYVRYVDLVNNTVVTQVSSTVGYSNTSYPAADATETFGARFNQTRGITWDGTNLLITDFGTNVIRWMNPITGTIQPIADAGAAFALGTTAGSFKRDFGTGLFSDGMFVANPLAAIFHPTRGFYIGSSYGLWRLD